MVAQLDTPEPSGGNPGPSDGGVSRRTAVGLLGVRDLDHPYGFAAFTADPGRLPGDTTRLHVTYYNVCPPGPRRPGGPA